MSRRAISTRSVTRRWRFAVGEDLNLHVATRPRSGRARRWRFAVGEDLNVTDLSNHYETRNRRWRFAVGEDLNQVWVRPSWMAMGTGAGGSPSARISTTCHP